MADEKRIAGKDAARAERERRLAKALRDNLRRRKAAEKPKDGASAVFRPGAPKPGHKPP